MKRLLSFVTLALLTPLFAAADPWLSIPQILAADEGGQWDPVICSNSVHDEFLIVWTSDVSGPEEIVGVRIDSQGLPIGSSFQISPPGNNQWDPAVAYDPVGDRYLVVWTYDYSGDGSDTDIHGRYVPWDGPSPGLANFSIDEAVSIQSHSTLVYSPGTLEFLVVWEENDAPSPDSIFGRRLSADGSDSTPAFAITNGPLNSSQPKVAWNRRTEQYLVVYEQDGGGSQDIYGSRLTATGGVITPAIGIAGWPGGEWNPDVSSCRGDFMVVWIGELPTKSDSDTEVFVRAVSGDGTVGTIVTDLPGDFTNESGPTVRCNEAGKEYLVSWYGLFTDSNNYGILGSFVELDASPQGDFFAIYAPSLGNDLDFRNPLLAFGADALALVAWESDRPPDGTSIDFVGRFVGNRLFADDFESGSDVYWCGEQ